MANNGAMPEMRCQACGKNGDWDGVSPRRCEECGGTLGHGYEEALPASVPETSEPHHKEPPPETSEQCQMTRCPVWFSSQWPRSPRQCLEWEGHAGSHQFEPTELETVWIVVRKNSIDSVWMNSALAAARGAALDGEWKVQNHPLRRWLNER